MENIIGKNLSTVGQSKHDFAEARFVFVERDFVQRTNVSTNLNYQQLAKMKSRKHKSELLLHGLMALRGTLTLDKCK